VPTLPEIEVMLRERLDAFPPAARAELLHVLLLPDFERPARICGHCAKPRTRSFAELPVDCEDDRLAWVG
jgi:hypothetical protein